MNEIKDLIAEILEELKDKSSEEIFGFRDKWLEQCRKQDTYSGKVEKLIMDICDFAANKEKQIVA